MKRIVIGLAVLAALLSLAACATSPEPPAPTPTIGKFEILQHKGTTLGVMTPPAWVEAAVNGPRAVEKLPDYKDMYVTVVDFSGPNLQGVQLKIQNMDAAAEISRYLSTRVKDTFAGAQVGDTKDIETYFERTVKLVSEARFSGFRPMSDWWVQLRWYKPDKPKVFDHDEFRVIQLFAIDKNVLKEQLDKILSDAEAAEPKTPEKQRAMDLVQQSFFDGF